MNGEKLDQNSDYSKEDEAFNLEVKNLIEVIVQECKNAKEKGLNKYKAEHTSESLNRIYDIKTPYFARDENVRDFAEEIFKETQVRVLPMGYKAEIEYLGMKNNSPVYRVEYRVEVKW